MEVKYFSAAITAWCPRHVLGSNSHLPNDFKFLFSGSYKSCIIFLITMHLLRKLDLIQRKQHQTQKFVLKAPEPCQNIHVLNMAYWHSIMLLLNLSVVVPLGLLSHCVLHYLLSQQVLLFFQKEKEEEAASCKTQIIPPVSAFGLHPRFLQYNDKDGKTFCRKLGQFYNEKRWNLMFQADLG